MCNNKGFSLVETALVILIMSATIFAFINVMNVQAQKAALKNYSKDLTNTYQTFLDAFIKYVQKVNPTTSTTYTCTTIKTDPDKFLPDSFSCIDNLGQSLEWRVSFKGTSVYGYFVYGNPGNGGWGGGGGYVHGNGGVGGGSGGYGGRGRPAQVIILYNVQ